MPDRFSDRRVTGALRGNCPEMEALMEKRYYGLFERREGKWVRMYPDRAYHKQTAVRLFQSALLDGVFCGKERSLRVVPKPVFGPGQ